MESATQPASGRARFGLVCALREELGALAERVVDRRRHLGLELLFADVGGTPLVACVSGIGKVAAARAACGLLASGPLDALLVVGVCGGLRRHLGPGALVHCTTAVQTDFASRDGRVVHSDARLRQAWQAVAGGGAGWFLTADRPVLSVWRRLRLARAFAGDCVADMETAAVGAVASAAGVRWAALRAVTDRASGLGAVHFKLHYPSQAGRAADTVPALLHGLTRGAT